MNGSSSISLIDKAMRFLFYVLLFWLPYSPAVIEICVIAAIILWVIKRVILFRQTSDISVTGLTRAFAPEPSFLNRNIAFFLGSCILSILSTALWQDALRGFLTKTFEWFIIFFFAMEVLKEKKHVQTAITVFLISAVAVLADGFIQLITQHDIFFGYTLMDQRINASLRDPNSLGAYLFFVFFILQAQILDASSWGKRLFLALILLLTVAVLALTYSRSAWMGMGAAILFVLIFAKGQVKWSWLLVVLLVVGLFVFTSREMRARERPRGYDFASSAGWRVSLWEDSIKVIQDKPLFGHGLNTYMRLFQNYRRKINNAEYELTYAHNCYLQMAVEVGLVGLSTFLILLGNLFLQTLRQWRKGQSTKLIIVLLAAIFAFLVQSFLDVNFYSLQLMALWWAMTGILVATIQIEKQELLAHNSVGRVA